MLSAACMPIYHLYVMLPTFKFHMIKVVFLSLCYFFFPFFTLLLFMETKLLMELICTLCYNSVFGCTILGVLLFRDFLVIFITQTFAMLTSYKLMSKLSAQWLYFVMKIV